MRPRRTPRSSSTSSRASIDLGEDAACSGGDDLACLGRRDASARALEQFGAQLAFEPSNLVRQRRLGDVELFRGPGEVAMTSDRFDAAKLAELHENDRRTRSLSYELCIASLDRAGPSS